MYVCMYVCMYVFGVIVTNLHALQFTLSRRRLWVSASGITRTTVNRYQDFNRTCYKDDVESQWKSLKFESPPSENASTKTVTKFCTGDYFPVIYCGAKFHYDSIRGFCLPSAYAKLLTKCSLGWFGYRGRHLEKYIWHHNSATDGPIPMTFSAPMQIDMMTMMMMMMMMMMMIQNWKLKSEVVSEVVFEYRIRLF